MVVSSADIWSWLETVPDPEIPVLSVVDLGVVRDVSVHDGKARVTITPTYTGCPAMRVIEGAITEALEDQGIATEVQTQLAPPWTTDWMTPKGKAQLESYGIAPPRAAGGPERCPRCRSESLAKVSQFGSTPCKAQWRCEDCLEPFDYFKCI
jgi:ring-1,2-phenylacetyl-CoA epoxidase subunit PaaD